MKINAKVPKRQKSTLDYMRTIEPVSRTLDDFIKAILAVSKGANLETLPESVRGNKAFDGHHTGTEGERVMSVLRTTETLKIRVGRGYLAMEQGKLEDIVARQLKMSDRFHVAFVSPQKNDLTERSLGFEITILRDGTLHHSINSVSALTS